jgi:transcription initiation factor TFIIIB Brf1 subunit/transcription initiation factor TFIIB
MKTSTTELELGLIKGELCNRNGCAGIIAEHDTDTSCSCHINPPCSHCVDDRNYCPVCDWQGIDEQKQPAIDKEQQERNRLYYGKQNKEWQAARNLFYAKYTGKESIEKLEMRTESHTHFTQIVLGVFPEGTETRESIEQKAKGTFGGRFTFFGKNKFEYIAYTD